MLTTDLKNDLLNRVILKAFRFRRIIASLIIPLLLFPFIFRKHVFHLKHVSLKRSIFIKKAIIDLGPKKQFSLKRKFHTCVYLTRIIIKNSIIIPKYTFRNCISLKRVFIGPKTQIIDNGAFENCINLQVVYIPRSLELIKTDAFKNCINLKSIIVY